MAIPDSPTPERMFTPPPGTEVDPTLVLGVHLSVGDWHTIVEALSKQEDHRSQHLCTMLRRTFVRAEPRRVWVAELAEL